MKIKILVVSHDAGGANILNALVKKYSSDFNWNVYADGPALKILREGLNIVNCSRKNLNIRRVVEYEKPDLILTSTSWASDIEIDFIRHAKKKGIKTAAFLDHWCNYRERFGYPGEWKKNVPDIVFVGDKWAYDIALKEGFPEKILRQIENPYIEDIMRKRKLISQSGLSKRRDNKIRILYLSEPIYEHTLKRYGNPYYWGYTEYEIAKDLATIQNLCKDFLIELKIRLHPAEKKDKYKKIGVRVSNNQQLIKDCLWSDIIIGSDTMGLVIGSAIGKKAISYIPNVKKVCSLPQKEIMKIHSIGKLIKEVKAFKKNGKIKNYKNRAAFNRAFLKEISN